MTAPIPLLTVPEVAALLKVHRTTVDREIARRRLKVVYVGRLPRVRWTEYERYVEGRKG